MARADPPHSAAFQFHRNHNQGFAHKLSPANVLLLASQASLINLDTSAQPFPSQPYHRLPQLLQHQPGRLIAAQTEFTLQTLGAQCCRATDGDAGGLDHGGSLPGLENRLGKTRSSLA